MLYSHIDENFLGLKDVMVKNIDVNNVKNEIYIEMPVIIHTCPHCGKKTAQIHDYRQQRIKDSPAFGKQTILVLRKRRYRCICGKCFYEKTPLLPRYYRMTTRLSVHIIEELSSIYSFTSVAREFGVSTSTIIRIFDLVLYGKPKLPQVLSIDELRGMPVQNINVY